MIYIRISFLEQLRRIIGKGTDFITIQQKFPEFPAPESPTSIFRTRIAAIVRNAFITYLTGSNTTVFTLCINQIHCRTKCKEIMKKHQNSCPLLLLETEDSLQSSIKILVCHKLIDPDLIHTHHFVKHCLQIIGKKLHLILFILICEIKTIAHNIIANRNKPVSLLQGQPSFFHKICCGTTTKIMVKRQDCRNLQLPVEKLHLHIQPYRTKWISSAIISSIPVIIRMLAKQCLTVILQKALLFL